MYAGREAIVQKKLTITLDGPIYDGLCAAVGRRRIRRFIQSLVRSHVISMDLDAAYRQMAQEKAREAEAFAWAKTTRGHLADAAR
jgi:hypothetical protein